MSAGMSVLAVLGPMLTLCFLFIWTTEKTKKKRQEVSDTMASYHDLANRAQRKLGDCAPSPPGHLPPADCRLFVDWWNHESTADWGITSLWPAPPLEYSFWPSGFSGAPETADLVEQLLSKPRRNR